MSNELKDCPFCGSSASIQNGPPHLWYAECLSCGVEGSIKHTEDEAVNAWNLRAKVVCQEVFDGSCSGGNNGGRGYTGPVNGVGAGGGGARSGGGGGNTSSQGGPGGFFKSIIDGKAFLVTPGQDATESKGGECGIVVPLPCKFEDLNDWAKGLLEPKTEPKQAPVSVPPEFKEALQHLQNLAAHDSYETEYDGRMMTICPSCREQEGKHDATCEFVLAKEFFTTTIMRYAMGEYADDYFRNEVKRLHGFDPGSESKDPTPAKRTQKVPCPTCGKMVIGLKDHMRAAHPQEPA